MLAGEHQPVGKQASTPRKSPLGGHPRQVGKVVALRKMSQNDIRRLAVVGRFEEIGGGLVREMADA